MSELPPGWEWTMVGHVTLPVAKIDPRIEPDLEFDYIDIGGVDGDRGEILQAQRLAGCEAPSRARQLVRAGDTVLSTVRTYMRKTALVSPGLDGQVASTGFSVLRPAEGVHPKYLYHAVRRQEFVDALSLLQTGSSYPAVRERDVRAMPVPLAPWAEQERIVAAIEDHLSRLDAAEDVLSRARARLATLRSRLVECVLGVSNAPALEDDEPTVWLPRNWTWVRASEACEMVSSGSTPNAADLHSGSGEIPFVKVHNLGFDGGLHFALNPTFVARRTHEGKLRRSRLIPGDVLINIVGPPLGKISVVPDDHPEWNMNQAVAAFRPAEGLLTEFLAYVLMARGIVQPLLLTGKATAGQINLNISACRRLWFPVPSVPMQRELVRRLDAALTTWKATVDQSEAASARAAGLRRSILAAAFSGQLVPQDPNDEPASVLLERIRAERATATPTKRTRKAKAS